MSLECQRECLSDIAEYSNCSPQTMGVQMMFRDEWVTMENDKDETNLMIAKSHQIKLYKCLLSKAPAMLSRKVVNGPSWDSPMLAQMYLMLAASYVGTRGSCQATQHWWNIWLFVILSLSVPTVCKIWNDSGYPNKIWVKYCFMQPILNSLFEVQL